MLEARRRAQRLVHECLVDVAARLAPGDSEQDGARMVRDGLAARGSTGWFHEPYVWFGDHTAPRAMRRAADFQPTNRRLQPGSPVILDAAPLFGEMIVDTSFTFACGLAPNAELLRLIGDLAAVRALVLDQARAARGPGEIFRAVEELAVARGCRTCHRLVPFGPLAHRVDHLRAPHVGARVAGVDIGTLVALGGRDLAARLVSKIVRVDSPLWTAHGGSTGRGLVGLWSVEPHLARDEIGAKFEEVLVVTEEGASWLDEDSWVGPPRAVFARSSHSIR